MPKVLAIDDSEDIHALLKVRLKGEDINLYHAMTAVDGLAQVRELHPDLILLDLQLPEMSGFEVCSTLKADAAVGDIPVIFLSGNNEITDKARGLEVGAIDYITKPFEPAELIARVRAGLRSKYYQDELKARERELAQVHHELAEHMGNELEHAKQLLIQSEKLAGVGQMVASIGHEITNPVSLMAISVELLENMLDDHDIFMSALFVDTPEAEPVKRRFDEMLGDMRGVLRDCHTASQRMTNLSRALATQSRVDLKPTTGLGVNDIVSESLTIVKGKLKRHEVQESLGELPTLSGRRSHIGQVITNLLSNAGDALDERYRKETEGTDIFHGVVRVVTEVCELNGVRGVQIVVADNGYGVPEELRQKVFEEFFTTKPAGVGTGLGLALCSAIIVRHGGSIAVEQDSELGGARFVVSLPLEHDDGCVGTESET